MDSSGTNDNISMTNNRGGQDDQERPSSSSFPIYLVVPSGKSYFFSVVIAVVIYFIYLMMIGYMTSYSAKFVPNYAMLWDFMVGMNTTNYQNEFVQYLENVLAYASINLNNDSNQEGEGGFWKNGKWFSTKDSFVGNSIREGLDVASSPWTTIHTMENVTSIGQNMWSNLQKMWNQLMIQAFVQGKKVKVSRI
jgi:hypothetical protein